MSKRRGFKTFTTFSYQKKKKSIEFIKNKSKSTTSNNPFERRKIPTKKRIVGKRFQVVNKSKTNRREIQKFSSTLHAKKNTILYNNSSETTNQPKKRGSKKRRRFDLNDMNNMYTSPSLGSIDLNFTDKLKNEPKVELEEREEEFSHDRKRRKKSEIYKDIMKKSKRNRYEKKKKKMINLKVLNN